MLSRFSLELTEMNKNIIGANLDKKLMSSILGHLHGKVQKSEVLV